MDRTPVSQPDRRALSTMLLLRDVYRHDWSTSELRDMLRHQLAAPLHLSLGTLSGEVAHQIRTAAATVPQPQPPPDPLMTLGQLLHHPAPPVELLKLVKRFAKMCRNDPENPLPSEIVMLLYYASIAVARQRRGEGISDLPPAALRRGLKWLVAQAWVDDETKSLLSDATRAIERGGAGGNADGRDVD